MYQFKLKNTAVLALGLVMSSSLIVSSCDDNNSSGNPSDNTVSKTYRVTLHNVTNNQPMSPMAVVFHKSGYHLWQAGQASSVALEKLAEGGDNAEVLMEASQHEDFLASQAGTGAIPPGGSETLELITSDTSNFRMTVASMLVNTNDAFAGVVSGEIANLAKGERFSMQIPVWDAGTEVNSEAAGSLPGPADGGEGYNASRDGDADFVAIHQGVVTQADGVNSSVLNESHRFDNPVGIISVERVK